MKRLKKMGVSYRKEEHIAVFSAEDKEKSGLRIWDGYKVSKKPVSAQCQGGQALSCGDHCGQETDLRRLAEKIGSTRLSFGSEQRLEKYLKVNRLRFAFCVLNDEERAVTVVFDEALMGEKYFALHPNENTATIFIDFEDVERLVKEHGNEIVTQSYKLCVFDKRCKQKDYFSINRSEILIAKHVFYLDNAATTRISDRVYNAMLPYLRESYGNPGAIYSLGREAARALKNSRLMCAKALSCEQGEIYSPPAAVKATIGRSYPPRKV